MEFDCSSCSYPCVEQSPKNSGVIIHGKRVLSCMFSDSLPTGILSNIMAKLKEQVYFAQNHFGLASPNQQDNAFNNVRGYWTRCIFASTAWNLFCENPIIGNSCLIPLPSTASLRLTQIFDPDANNALDNGLIRNLAKQGIELGMSNPDFVCISELPPDIMEPFKTKICNLSENSQQILDFAYKQIIGYCLYNGLKFGIALKTSLRSDRRYQVAYEGSVLKALIAHLQVRFWDTSFYTGFYAVVANRVGDEDRIVLSAPATHSIVDVHTPPIKAIDEIFQVNSTDDIVASINKMITSNFTVVS